MPANLSRSVMVVDDDHDIRASLQEILQDEGYTVVSASDGMEALTQLRLGARPQLILLDLMMPIMDGFQFCREVRKDPALSLIPVIVFSADALAEERANACGANGFLSKPTALTDLLRTIQRYVPL